MDIRTGLRLPFLYACLGLGASSIQAQRSEPGQVAALVLDREAAGITFQRIQLFSPTVEPVSALPSLRGVVNAGSILEPSPLAIASVLRSAPQEVEFILPTTDGAVRLHLSRAEIFSSDLSIILASTGRAVEPTPALHYRGIIAGDPLSLAAISIFEDEVMGFVSDVSGNHVLGKLGGATDDHIYYPEEDMVTPPVLECATPDDGQGYHPSELEAPDGDRSLNCVDLYWEVNYDIFQNKGGLVNTTNYITGLFNQSATLYDNDGVSVLLSQLYIWDVTSPYTSTSSSGLLTQFKNYRNSFNGDLAHLMGYAGGGGIAAGFAGLCASNLDNSMCYSGIQSTYNNVPTYSWSVEVVTHEQGHLLGSRHTHACVWNGNNTAIDGCGPSAGYGYEGSCSGAPIPSGGGTIMSYCHLNAVGINFNNGFGPQPTTVILNNVEAAGCLSACTAPPCETPAGLSSNGLTGTSAQLNWFTVTGALSYTLQWKTSAAATWNNVPGITLNDYGLTGLTALTAYDYRVRAICAGGSSAYSLTSNFTTPCVWGASCNDGDPGTMNDVFNGNCVCSGTPIEGYFSHIAKVVAGDRSAGDQFGNNVSISGDYAIVGAWHDDQNAGAAYIFVRSGGTWVQQQKIVASDRAANDLFGYAVSISGDHAIVSAMNEDHDAAGSYFAINAGSAYIYTRSGDTWTQQQKIVAADREANDNFGYSVAIEGDHAIIGAHWEEEDALGNNNIGLAGSAYIFVRNGTTWTQQQKIVASDRAQNDDFGWSVAISGDRAVVATPWQDRDALGNNYVSNAGAAYIFVRNGTTWSQEQKIVASERSANDYFGERVGMSADHIILGARYEDQDASGGNTAGTAGAAYIFVRNGSTWTQQQKLVPGDRAADDMFGSSVGISGDRAIIGACQEDHDALGSNAAADAGSAYIFVRNGSIWVEQQKILAGDRAPGDNFGSSSAISGDQAIVGAYLEDEDTLGSNTLSEAGSAYFFAGTLHVRCSIILWLEGPYNAGTLLMNDALRLLPSFPLSEPYTAMGFNNAAGGGGETTSPAVLTVTGNNAVVDWLRLELRNGSDPSAVVATRHALLQRDGDVVATDGSSPVTLAGAAGNYYLAVRHRNHLGAMTASAIALGPTTTTIDFRSAATSTYGANARKPIGNALALWAGSTLRDTPAPILIKYTGTSNDRDPILTRVGSTTPNNAAAGYFLEDVNLDGSVKYTGTGNDRDPILLNVGSTTPNNTRSEQVP